MSLYAYPWDSHSGQDRQLVAATQLTSRDAGASEVDGTLLKRSLSLSTAATTFASDQIVSVQDGKEQVLSPSGETQSLRDFARARVD